MAFEKLHLDIKGMTCAHCEKSVSNVLKELQGVKESRVDLASHSADLVIDTDKISRKQVIDAVNATHIYTAS